MNSLKSELISDTDSFEHLARKLMSKKIVSQGKEYITSLKAEFFVKPRDLLSSFMIYKFPDDSIGPPELESNKNVIDSAKMFIECEEADQKKNLVKFIHHFKKWKEFIKNYVIDVIDKKKKEKQDYMASGSYSNNNSIENKLTTIEGFAKNKVYNNKLSMNKNSSPLNATNIEQDLLDKIESLSMTANDYRETKLNSADYNAEDEMNDIKISRTKISISNKVKLKKKKKESLMIPDDVYDLKNLYIEKQGTSTFWGGLAWSGQKKNV